MMGMSVGDVVASLRLDSSQFDAALKTSQDRMRSFSASLGRLGSYLSFRLTLPLTYFGRRAVKSFASFDDAINRSAAVTRGAVGVMRTEMEKTALAISQKTILSATELAEGYFALGQAGYSAAQAIKALPVITDFAVASQVELDTATRYLARSMEGLGMASEDPTANMEAMTAVSNAFTYAAITTTAEIEDFAVAMTHAAAPALRLVNKSMEEGTAVLMAFARAGIVAEEAGTLLWTTVRDLQRANIKARNEWDRMGLSIYDSGGKMRNLGVIFGELEEKFAGMSDQGKKVSLMLLGFQDRSLRGIQALMGFSAQMIEWQNQMEKGGDLTKEIAETYLKSFRAQLIMVGNSLNVVSISIGRVLAPIIEKVNVKIKQFTGWWETLSDHTKLFYVEIAGLVAITGPLLIIFSKLVMATTFMSIGFSQMALALGGLAKAFAVIGIAAGGHLAAIAAILGGIYAIRAVWNQSTGAMKQVMEGFVNSVRVGWEQFVNNIWTPSLNFIHKHWGDTLQELRTEWQEFLIDATSTWKGIKAAWKEMKIDWNLPEEELIERVNSVSKRAREAFVKAFTDTWEPEAPRKFLEETLKTAEIALKDFTEISKIVLGEVGDATKKQLKEDFEVITSVLTNKIREINDKFVKGMPDEKLNEFIEQMKSATKAAGELGEVPFDTFSMHLRGAKDLAENFRQVAVRAFNSTEDAIVDMVKTGKFEIKNLAEVILTDLMRAILRARMAMITENFVQPAMGSIASGVAGLFSGGGAVSGATAENQAYFKDYQYSTPTQLISTRGYAEGGIALTPQLAAVAERKPEAILPLDELGKLGQAPTVIINNQAGDKVPIKQNGPVKFDGKKYVVDLIIDDVTHYGDLYTLFSGMGGNK